MLATPTSELSKPDQGLRSLEALLSSIADAIEESGRAFLFSGDRLALDLPAHRVGPKRVKYGLASHHDWAFQATLLRFAWSEEPTRLLVVSGGTNTSRYSGWVLGRSSQSFWATPMPTEQAASMLVSLGTRE